MSAIKRYGLEQARNQLPSIAANAHAGASSIITRHGKPYAAIVPVEAMQRKTTAQGILALRGTGRGLWGPEVNQSIRELRDEWGYA